MLLRALLTTNAGRVSEIESYALQAGKTWSTVETTVWSAPEVEDASFSDILFSRSETDGDQRFSRTQL